MLVLNLKDFNAKLKKYFSIKFKIKILKIVVLNLKSV